MGKLRIRFLSTFRDVVDNDNIDLDVSGQVTLGELLDILSKKYGSGLTGQFEKLDYMMIFVNNVEYRTLNGLSTVLKDGDQITFGHILAGGSWNRVVEPRTAVYATTSNLNPKMSFPCNFLIFPQTGRTLSPILTS